MNKYIGFDINSKKIVVCAVESGKKYSVEEMCEMKKC